jgi:hypothetical protein
MVSPSSFMSDIYGGSGLNELYAEFHPGLSVEVSHVPVAVTPSTSTMLSHINTEPLGCPGFFLRMPVVFSETTAWNFGPLRREAISSFTSWVLLPEPERGVQAPIAEKISEILDMTGWSQRELASILLTSHTTVRKLLAGGEVSARSISVASRVGPVHDLISRLYVVARRDSAHLAIAMRTSVDGRRSSVDLLAGGDDNAAYATALRALRGQQRETLGRHPKRIRPADATMELS